MNSPLARAAVAAIACLTLAGCGSFNVNLWPFGEQKDQVRSKVPSNATAYQCTNGKRFYVRTLEDGAAVWLILSDREVRLDKTGEGRYANGSAVLDLSAGDATLAEGPATANGCKPASATAS